MDLRFPAELPISTHRGEIEEALRAHPVVIVCGDTGSGKTTQLPKMALELGRGARARIGCTQPRRLAAVTVARRVAEEFGEEVGATIGYQHRFDRRLSRQTRVKFMTDGVLLAETRRDPLLRAYDTLILDEAHERSLNIDFLLGIVKRILPRRPDLKVVVSSATLDADLFSRFFGGAPVVSVPGRLFPIEIRYQPPSDAEDADLPRDVARAVDSLPDGGDVLVFLPGERDIRDCADALAARDGAEDDVIPLLASLPAAQQQRAFRLSSRRRVILATNVAETSLTIPGIRFVVDSGLARISRYVQRTQVQRLQIEPVSQASANQRAGRCGRLGPGVCLRLYSEEDFLRRERYTAPEILRSSLAGVILTMLDLGLGDIADFPFISPPDSAGIRAGIRELLELGAISVAENGTPSLTPVGRQLAALPVEPRIGRMILAGGHESALPRVIPVAAFLACEDPRRRPIDEKEKADQAHARFKTPNSDFAAILKLWQWWEAETRGLSQNKTRRLCAASYLSYTKMREWQDLAARLADLAKSLGLAVDRDGGGDDGFHRALLAGLLGRIGLLDTESRDYRGAHGLRFLPFPGSALFKHPPPWIMAGELVDTSRLYARPCAALDPAWIEPVAGPLCRHSYHSPEWDAEHGFVRATEQVTLYGLVVVHGRRCDYSRIDPAASRDVFIRRGLVDAAIPNPPPDVRRNNAVIAEIRRRADKRRRPDWFDEDALAAFFDGALPDGLCSAPALRRWLARATPAERAAFRLRPEDWLPADDGASGDFPDAVTIGNARFALSYSHSLDDEKDGITCTARASQAAALRKWRADWLVPGAIREKLAWMVSCLPSAQRRILSPVDDVVARLMTYLRPGEEPLCEALSKVFAREWGLRVPPTAWDGIHMPPHFLVRFRVIDDRTRRTLAAGRDLEEVLAKAGVAAGPAPGSPADDSPPRHVAWDFGDLPSETVGGEAGWQLRHYPALHDEGDAVTIRLYADSEEARAAHAAGVARLYVLSLGPRACAGVRFRTWPVQAAWFLKQMGYAQDRMADDLLFAAATEAFVRDRPEIRTHAAFDARAAEGGERLGEARAALLGLVFDTVTAAAALRGDLELDSRIPRETADAVGRQLDWLVFPGFLRAIPLARLRHYPRYLEAVQIRLERARLNPAADARREEEAAAFWSRYRKLVESPEELRFANRRALVDYRWMVEEFRVSLFAQELKTPEPVSAKRLEAKWTEAAYLVPKRRSPASPSPGRM